MDSTETTLEGEISTVEETVTEQPQTFEIDGAIVTLDELQKGYLRQSDYTRKTQELAKQREQLATSAPKTQEEISDEEVFNTLKSKGGFLTKEDLERERKMMLEEVAMERFFEANPELSKHEKAIKAIAKTDSRALEDIIVDYGFSSSDKLQKAKSSRAIVGNSPKGDAPQKAFKDMSPTEYEKWRATNMPSKKGSFE